MSPYNATASSALIVALIDLHRTVAPTMNRWRERPALLEQTVDQFALSDRLPRRPAAQ